MQLTKINEKKNFDKYQNDKRLKCKHIFVNKGSQ